MRQHKFPPGWDEERVRKVLAHYEEQTEDEAVAEDEVAFEDSTQTVMEVPHELVPAIRALIAKHQSIRNRRGKTMITLDLPETLEQHFWNIVQDSYDGDLQAAVTAFLKLHEKYGWKEQFVKDIKSVREEVRLKGGIKAKTIEDTVRRYRETVGKSGV